jgi:hypothetical protein
VKSRDDCREQLCVVGWRSLEHRARGDVHVCYVSLQVKEGRVEPAQAVRVGHAGIFASGSGPGRGVLPLPFGKVQRSGKEMIERSGGSCPK